MNWRLEPLGEVGVAVLDCDHRTPEPRESGYPYIAIPEIQDGRVDLERCRRISQEDLLSWTRRTKPRGGDVLVTRRGRVGDTAPIPDGVDCAIGQNLVLLRADKAKVEPRFLRWATRGQLWARQVEQWLNVGAVFSSLNVKDIAKMRIPVPDLATQTAIADVLGALDDKIAANEATLARNLMLSRAIFASLHKPLEVPLSTLARFVNGRNFTKEATGNGRPVIRIAELNNGLGGSTVWNSVEAAEDNVARAGDILFAWSGSLTVARWAGSEGLINQHIFKVLPSGQPSWLVFHVLLEKLADFKAIAADKATTMGHIQRRHLDEVVAVPDEREIDAVGARMVALWEQETKVRIENERLAATRDALLPELMSGRLMVADTLDVRDSL